MNRLLATGEAPAPAADTPAPGSKEHLRVQAKELGVASSGTKSEIWSRIAAKQGENVDRRIRSKPSQMAMASAPEPVDPAIPADGGNRLMQTMPAEPMASAAALQIPEGIPAPNPDGTPPQAAPAAPAAPNGDFEAQLAELSAMLQQIGQAQAPGPVANARDSMAAAAPPPPQRTWQDSQNRLLAR